MEKLKVDSYQRTIEEQSKKLENYKLKFKDVVEAYKSLSKEKVALETSLKALTSAKASISIKPHSNNLKNNHEISSNEIINQETESSVKCEDNKVIDGAEEEEAIQSSDNSQALEDDKELNVLANSLMILTEQKNQMETKWIEERKLNKIEIEKKDDEIENLLKQIQQSENDIAQWRGKLRTQQSEHSRQQDDCNMMIKELQSLLNSQKVENQDLVMQMSDIKRVNEDQKKSTSTHINAILEREKLIKKELDYKSNELKEIQTKTTLISPQIPLLKQQLSELKEKSALNNEEESRKVNELEWRLKEVLKDNETRVNDMETKVLQLSEVLGEVERNKKKDQDTIKKLTDKNTQLDLEISTLTSLIRLPDLDSMLNDLNNHDLYNKTKFIISMLRSRNYHSALIYELVLEQEDIHKLCTKQFEQLQEEFERYKLRAQSVLKNKTKETNPEKETVRLKGQISELKDKISTLRESLETKENELKKKEDTFAMMVKSLEAKHSTEMEKVVAEMRQRVCDMEGEVKRQRDRTVNMLAEKDQEIVELKSRRTSPQTTKSVSALENEVGASSAMEEDTSITLQQLLSSRSKDQSSSDRILHFQQEKAIKEGQINTLRKEKYHLENEVKELRLEYVSKETKLEEEVALLKEEIRRGDRTAKRDTANLEYLKNIVYQYMLTRDSSSKQRIAKAISTILQFSPSERKIIYTTKGWSSF